MVTFPCKWLVVHCKTCTRVNGAVEPNAPLPESCPCCGSHGAEVVCMGYGRTSRQLPNFERLHHEWSWGNNHWEKAKDELIADRI